MDSRRLLLEIFDAALRAVDGRACVERALHGLPLPPAFDVIAVGKAAMSMVQGVRAVRGEDVGALIITKEGHGDATLAVSRGMTLIESAHPVPDARSLAAGEQLVARLVADPARFTLFLVSGGASSLVEALHPGATLADLRALTEHGLSSGWDIAELNSNRARLSKLKAGGVARLLGDRAACALFVSDVPGDDPDVIGSGLLGRDEGRPDRIERHVVANVEVAVQAAVAAGAARGLVLESGARRFAGDVGDVAREFITALRETHADGLVWGGESTVKLPVKSGRGGRNTHLALITARLLRAGEKLTVLAAGTDGTDGPTEDAGALVDAGTLERAELGGCDAERALREFDSGTALEASEDLVHTGPTGTNVGDLLIGIKAPRVSRDSGRVL